MTSADHPKTPAPTSEGEELGPRKAAILEAVVSEYIGTAQPVGSQHVARAAGVGVSSATVRSEMVALEHEGYLVQPHTSAGRVPTDKGYRFFVDRLTEPGVLGPVQRQKVSRFFAQVHGEMEEMLERTSGLLSDLTSYASVVVAPGHESVAIRSVQLVGLGPRLALLVVVLADGSVEKRTVDLGDDVPDDVLAAVGGRLHTHAQGRAFSDVTPVPPVGDARTDRVAELAGRALLEMASGGEREQVFVGGPSRLATAFDAVEQVRSVLGILEQQLVVVTLLRDVLDRGLSVAIGAEHGFEPLASCAVVVAPVSIDGVNAGAVGLVGPTRMDYAQALAAAHVVGERLGERLGDSRR
ncbi:MAG: heat-inducible transcriptional repressor HrcA, partial [Acidimicrobiales bacterium]